MSNKVSYKAWKLQSSFKPVEIVVVSEHNWCGTPVCVDNGGKHYRAKDIHQNKAEAIQAGWKAIEKAEAAHAKQRALIDKRKASLEKAAKA